MSNPNTGEALIILKRGRPGRPFWPRIPGMPSLHLHLPATASGGILYHFLDEFENVSLQSLVSTGCLKLLKSSPWVTGTVMAWLSGTVDIKTIFLATRLLKSEEGYPRLAIVVSNRQTRLLLWRTTYLSMSSKTLPGNMTSVAPVGVCTNQLPLLTGCDKL